MSFISSASAYQKHPQITLSQNLHPWKIPIGNIQGTKLNM